MNPTRIAELLRPFLGDASQEQLAPSLAASISTYIDILVRWNSRLNLTAVRDPEQIVTRHFGESLFAARILFPEYGDDSGRAALPARVPEQRQPATLAPVANDQRPATNDLLSVADLGSGAGFPGVPLKLWSPAISLTLIESSHKKATFLRELVRVLTLTDINIQNVRAETLPPSSFDLVTLRAVERFDSVLPVAAILVKSAGRLVLLIGSAQHDRACELLPGWSWEAPIPIPMSRSRVVSIGYLRPRPVPQ
jgi:16S rRNA (guanine527-N7)-methyltransferase